MNQLDTYSSELNASRNSLQIQGRFPLIGMSKSLLSRGLHTENVGIRANSSPCVRTIAASRDVSS